jgi:hypothetical protein
MLSTTIVTKRMLQDVIFVQSILDLYLRYSKELRIAVNNKDKANVISSILSEEVKKNVLPFSPKSADLLPYVRLNVKRSRLRKKFIKNPLRYRDRMPKVIVKEYTSKLLAKALSGTVWETLNRESFARKVLMIEPLSV